MARINLNDEYFIETDPLCWVLKVSKETYDKKAKKKTGRIVEQIIGYYRDSESLFDALLRDRERRFTDDFKGDMREYAETIKRIHEDTCTALTTAHIDTLKKARKADEQSD